MATATSWITRRPHPDGVEACIRDTNINVWMLVERKQHGLADETIVEDVQGLTREDLETAWDYYRGHKAEIDTAIRLNAEA
jgi:uncharacterized protein (DUF433 family)